MGEGLGEIGHSESQKGVVFLYLECSLERLKQPVGAGHRLEQPVVGNHFREGEVKAQPMNTFLKNEYFSKENLDQ